MNQNFKYVCKSRTEDGKEHICEFMPMGKENWYAVSVSDLGVDVTQFFDDEDFNDVAFDYARRFNLGKIFSLSKEMV